MANLPDGRDRWIRWDQELTSTCPECGRVWADHPGGIQIWAQDGHLGRVLPECPQELGSAHLLSRAAGVCSRLIDSPSAGMTAVCWRQP